MKRRRPARAAVTAAAGLLVASHAWPQEHPPVPQPPVAALAASPVQLDEGDPARRRIGSLLFLEGWRLQSRDVRFGGLSAMHVEDGEVIGLSDAGNLFRFRVPDRAGTAPVRIERVARGPGTGRWKGDRDVESLVVAGNRLWLAFEGRNSIWRYRRSDTAFEAAAAPRAMADWPTMRGAEAMLRLSDGRFLVFAEGPAAGDGTTPVLLFEGDPALSATRAVPLRYRAPAGYRPTDAAALPDGRLIILNRDVNFVGSFSARVTLADAAVLRPGALIEGREIAALAGGVTVDNMEALSVTREEGRTILWIASDDNFTPILQQTLLLKFALLE